MGCLCVFPQPGWKNVQIGYNQLRDSECDTLVLGRISELLYTRVTFINVSLV